MKRILFALVLTALAASAGAQWFDITKNVDNYQVGLNLGQAGHGTSYAGFGYGASLSVWGVYIDFLVSPPEHSTDNHVRDEMWLDDEAFVINAGYQIPVLPWLRVAPIIGYSQTDYGYTDASTVNVHVDSENSGHISHDYHVVEESIKSELNYGVGVFITPFSTVGLYGVASRRAIYGGISFTFGN